MVRASLRCRVQRALPNRKLLAATTQAYIMTYVPDPVESDEAIRADILDHLNFNGGNVVETCRPTAAVRERELQLSDAVIKVQEAATVGCIPSLADALVDLRTLPGSEPYLARPGNSLYQAISRGHREATKYLLQRDVSVTADAVTAATTAKDLWMLEALLQSDWDIDRTLSPATPSALG